MNRERLQKLVIASTNAGKVNEFRQMLGERFAVVALNETGFTDEIAESGETFFENALIKVKAVCAAFGEAVLADDSGLCVEVLNGAPGVYSARYAREGATADENNDKLLAAMRGAENRNAKFVASIVLLFPDGRLIDGYGETRGKILTERAGTNGFGYDPLFYSDELQKSFGLATPAEKNPISHRGRALADLLQRL